MSEPTYEGGCFCGAVVVTVTGAPEAMGFCHCSSCRHWLASPVNAFTLWKPSAVHVVSGSDVLGSFTKAPNSRRMFCKTCGGHVMTEHPEWQLVDVYAAIVPSFPFKPALHVNYAETVLRMRDGLPKLEGLPEQLGGTGRTIAE